MIILPSSVENQNTSQERSHWVSAIIHFSAQMSKKQIFGLTKSKLNPKQTPESSIFCLNFVQHEFLHNHVDHSKQWKFVAYFGNSHGPVWEDIKKMVIWSSRSRQLIWSKKSPCQDRCLCYQIIFRLLHDQKNFFFIPPPSVAAWIAKVICEFLLLIMF